MGGIVLKDHHFPTVGLAYLTGKIVPQVKIFGSITIANSIGGFNAEAVYQSADRGARIVWFPTLESEHFIKKCGSISHLKHLKKGFDHNFRVFRVTDETGKILAEVKEVLQAVKERNMVLGLGHLSPDETYTVIRYAQSIGIEKIKISHPQSILGIPLECQVELASLGVFMSYTFLNCLPGHGSLEDRDLAAMINAVGPERSILISDAGQLSVPHPAAVMVMFVSNLLKNGIKDKDIEKMIKHNPVALLEN